jgi:hypothetical protein
MSMGLTQSLFELLFLTFFLHIISIPEFTLFLQGAAGDVLTGGPAAGR